jgi:CelD/BcsL family acetyltransferase involved in cellulose biosynthesis
MTSGQGPAAARCVVVTALGTWAQQWDDLVAQAPVPSPFLRAWWLDAVATHNTEFLLFLADDRLIGGLALERRRRAFGVDVYRFAGSGRLCPDHLDLLAAPGQAPAVRRALADWWTRRGARVLDLAGLVEHSMLEAIFGSAATTTIDVAPWDVLPADAEEYIAARSSNRRKTLRQAQRRLATAGITHRRVASNDAEAALNDFVRLQRDRAGRAALLREMPRLSRALVAGLEAGEARIDVLESAAGPVAMWVSFELAGAVRAYQSARAVDDSYRDASAVLLVEVVRRACEDGCTELDLLRGAEPYKTGYVSRRRAVCRLRVAHGRRGAVVLIGLLARTRAAGLVKLVRAQRGVAFTPRSRRRAEE